MTWTMKIVKFFGLVAVVALSSTAISQTTICIVNEHNTDLIKGSCSGISPPLLQLSKDSSASDVIWSGTLSEGELVWPIEIAAYQYANGPRIIIRTPIGWFPIGQSSFDPIPAKIGWDISVEAPPSNTDREILIKAEQYLSNQSVWDKYDDRNCDGKTLISLYCALARATQDIMGSYQHRQPVMQIVRRIIQNTWPDRLSGHRLMDFNNHQETSFRDIQRLFELTELELKNQIQ